VPELARNISLDAITTVGTCGDGAAGGPVQDRQAPPARHVPQPQHGVCAAAGQDLVRVLAAAVTTPVALVLPDLSALVATDGGELLLPLLRAHGGIAFTPASTLCFREPHDLTYERRTHSPTHLGNVRLRVDDDGAIYVQVNREEPPLGQAWCSDFPTTPAARIDHARAHIAAILDRHGFAAFAHHDDGDRDDGYEEALTYWRDDSTARTVVVESGSVPEFRALLGKLFGVLGVTDDVA
jgi:hypothetical protein